MNFIELLPTAGRKQPVPTWIQTLYSAFPGASAEKIGSEIDSIMVDYRMVVSMVGGSFISAKSIGDVKLPHELPDARAASQLGYTPLRGVRSTIARLFADDGWKEVKGLTAAGLYELRNTSPGGRRLSLTFRVQKPGPSSRSIRGTMRLSSDRRTLTVTVMAERSMRREYEVPNTEVLSQIMENMRVVAKYLENTWVKDLEEALGPKPRRSKLGKR